MKNLSFFKNINKIYFIGIGGISLSALAQVLKNEGFIVAGSDVVKSEITEKLEKSGIKVVYNQNAKNISNFNPDLVVYTGAIKDDNKELNFVHKNNILCLERPKFISKILPFYKNVISISGTHGKSTTTCMIGEIFYNAGLNPTLHLGAESINLNANFLAGDNNYFINEACEYRKSFLDFKSDVGVILNIEEDHPDCYKNFSEINHAFSEFFNICDNVVVHEKYLNSLEIIDESKAISFGISSSNFSVKNIKTLNNGGSSFDVYKNNEFFESFVLNIFAEHNVFNALASIAVADFYGIDKTIIKESLQNFKGIKRRFEKAKSKFTCEVYFDYAHHPTEIKKLLQEIQFFNKPVICVFQPHTFTRTKQYFNDFLNSFNLAYQTVFYKTYSAREKALKGGRSKDIYLNLKNKQNVFYYNSFNKIIKHLKKYAKSNCIVLFVGAGDIYNIKNLIEK